MFEDLLDYLRENLPIKIAAGGYNSYEVFGKEAETPISDTIEEYLILNNITYTPKRAATKNDFPDLEVVIAGVRYALEHKAGVCNMKGEIKTTAANDMGTLQAYNEKIECYGDNIYCTFVKYSVLEDDTIQIEDIYFDKIYVFIGKGTGFDNQLKYREKDGNLRPKSWDDMENNITYFPTQETFLESIAATIRYRSERIVLKHLDCLDENALVRIKAKIDLILDQ